MEKENRHENLLSSTLETSQQDGERTNNDEDDQDWKGIEYEEEDDYIYIFYRPNNDDKRTSCQNEDEENNKSHDDKDDDGNHGTKGEGGQVKIIDQDGEDRDENEDRR